MVGVDSGSSGTIMYHTVRVLRIIVRSTATVPWLAMMGLVW